MEDYDELKTFIKIWLTATACLCYCYFIPTRISNSFPRLLALLPVVTAFFILPIPLSTFHLAGPTVFYLVWLGNFKLLLFAFNRGPLASACKLGLVSFVSIALLPINPKYSGNRVSDPDPNTNPDPVLSCDPIRIDPKHACNRVSDPDPVSFSSRKSIRINAKHAGNRVSDLDPDSNSVSDHKPNPINPKHGHKVSDSDQDPISVSDHKPNPNNPKYGNRVSDSDPDPDSVYDHKPNPINAKRAGIRVLNPDLNPYPILDPSHKPILLAIKALILAVIVNTYQYRNNINHNMILALYCCHVYLGVELVLALTAFIVNFILRFDFDIEPQFNEPYLSTSLQDFWGRRWNLMVTRILRPTVYKPVIEILTPVVGKQWGRLFAIFVTFLVSGLMHELIYYYFTRVWPTWEVTWFFVLHGVCVVVEVVVKKVVGGRVRVHRVVSRVVTVAFLTVTGGWLFLPQLLRNGVDVKAINEYTVAVNFLRSKFG